MSVEIEVKVDSQLAEKDLGKLNTVVKDIGKNATSATEKLANIARIVTTGLASASIIKTMTNMGDSLRIMSTRLRSMTDSQIEYNAALKDTRRIAMLTNSELDYTNRLYQSLRLLSNDIGGTATQAARVTQTIANSLTLAGANTGQVSGTLENVIEALAKGVLEGEKFEILFKNAPLLLRAVAEEMKVSVIELGNMARTGQITARDFFMAISRQYENMNEQARQIQLTTQMAFVNLRTSILAVYDSITKISAGDNDSGFIRFIDNLAHGIYRIAEDFEFSILQMRTRFWLFVGDMKDGFTTIAETATSGFKKAFNSITGFFSKVGDSVGKSGALNSLKSFFNQSFSIDIQEIDLSRFMPNLENVKVKVMAFLTSVERGFFWLYDKVVGNSYYPDMIYGIEKESEKLNLTPLDHVKRFAKSVESLFMKLGQRIAEIPFISAFFEKIASFRDGINKGVAEKLTTRSKLEIDIAATASSTKEMATDVRDKLSNGVFGGSGNFLRSFSLMVTSTFGAAIVTALMTGSVIKGLLVFLVTGFTSAIAITFGQNLVPILIGALTIAASFFGNILTKIIGAGLLITYAGAQYDTKDFTGGTNKLSETTLKVLNGIDFLIKKLLYRDKIEEVNGKQVKVLDENNEPVRERESIGKVALYMARMMLFFEAGRTLFKTLTTEILKAPMNLTNRAFDTGVRNMLGKEMDNIGNSLKSNTKKIDIITNRTQKAYADAVTNLSKQTMRTPAGNYRVIGDARAAAMARMSVDPTRAQRLSGQMLNQRGTDALAQARDAALAQRRGLEVTDRLNTQNARLTDTLDKTRSQFEVLNNRLQEAGQVFKDNIIRTGSMIGAVGGSLIGWEIGRKIADGMEKSPAWAKIGVQISSTFVGQGLGTAIGQLLTRILMTKLAVIAVAVGALALIIYKAFKDPETFSTLVTEIVSAGRGLAENFVSYLRNTGVGKFLGIDDASLNIDPETNLRRDPIGPNQRDDNISGEYPEDFKPAIRSETIKRAISNWWEEFSTPKLEYSSPESFGSPPVKEGKSLIPSIKFEDLNKNIRVFDDAISSLFNFIVPSAMADSIVPSTPIEQSYSDSLKQGFITFDKLRVDVKELEKQLAEAKEVYEGSSDDSPVLKQFLENAIRSLEATIEKQRSMYGIENLYSTGSSSLLDNKAFSNISNIADMKEIFNTIRIEPSKSDIANFEYLAKQFDEALTRMNATTGDFSAKDLLYLLNTFRQDYKESGVNTPAIIDTGNDELHRINYGEMILTSLVGAAHAAEAIVEPFKQVNEFAKETQDVLGSFISELPSPKTSNIDFRKDLLDLIGKAEAPGGYGQIYGGAIHPLEEMTIAEVKKLQDKMLAAGTHSPVGKYQINKETLGDLLKQTNTPDTALFNRELQDMFANLLLDRAGAKSFENDELSLVDFGKNLAKTWAGLPVLQGTQGAKVPVGRGESYHSQVADNKATIAPEEVEAVLGKASKEINIVSRGLNLLSEQVAESSPFMADVFKKAGEKLEGLLSGLLEGPEVLPGFDSEVIPGFEEKLKGFKTFNDSISFINNELRNLGLEDITATNFDGLDLEEFDKIVEALSSISQLQDRLPTAGAIEGNRIQRLINSWRDNIEERFEKLYVSAIASGSGRVPAEEARNSAIAYTESLKQGMKEGVSAVLRDEMKAKDFFEALADQFTRAVVDNFSDALVENFFRITTGGKNLETIIRDGVTSLFDFSWENIGNIFRTNKPLEGDDGPGIAYGTGGASTRIMETIQQSKTFMDADRASMDLYNGKSPVTDAVMKKTPQVEEAISGMFEKGVNGFNSFGETLLTGFGDFGRGLVGVFKDIGGVISNLLKSLTSSGSSSSGGSSILGIISAGIDLLGGGTQAAAPVVERSISAAQLLKYNTGGPVFGAGTGTSDSIPAMLSTGEFVINAAQTARHRHLLETINKGDLEPMRFATGGYVGKDVDTSSIAKVSNKSEQVFNITITGDISRQTKKEIFNMLPEIATGVNMHNREMGAY